MEIPRLGASSELQLPPYATATAMQDPGHIFDLHHSARQCWIPNPLSEARDQTHILLYTSRFVSAMPQRELQNYSYIEDFSENGAML